ncbi:hypothetical protein BD410DRAFT_835496 [Rickenella mellea]|uniref:Uncharacterized protein n=1 Tax=Rickenella mellea TaxID=50990 RepID=A0A4Y7QM06_9AGAM|nr:hypothetical protein BD410DRAFT_835496 [Rickenella mellea]
MTGQHCGVPPGDLCKKLLKRAQEKASKAATVSATAGSTSAAPSASGSHAVSLSGAIERTQRSPAVASTSTGGGKAKTTVGSGADEEGEWDDGWVTLMPVGGGFPADTLDGVL